MRYGYKYISYDRLEIILQYSSLQLTLSRPCGVSISLDTEFSFYKSYSNDLLSIKEWTFHFKCFVIIHCVWRLSLNDIKMKTRIISALSCETKTPE